MKRSQVVVIGGGHNGLTAATLLARSGQRVTLVEARDVLGGLAAGEEFAPGFRTTGILHESGTLRPAVASKLDLAKYGLQFDESAPALHALEREGPGLRLERDATLAAAEIAQRSPADAEAYVKWRAQLARLAPFVARVLSDAPPDLDPHAPRQLLDLLRTGVALRRLGEADMIELMHIGPMCVADWMQDTFESPLLQAALAWPGISGSWLGPWSAGSAANLLGRECTLGASVRGGPAALVRALEAAARGAGVEIVTGTAVSGIQVEGGAACGVTLADGRELPAHAIACSIEPARALIELLPRTDLPPESEDALNGYRTRGTTAKLHLALGAPLEIAPGVPLEHATNLESIDDLERAFDSIKYGEMSTRPHLEVRVPSHADPSLAPEGKHVASVLVHYVPYDLRAGWDDAARSQLEKRALDALEEVLPGSRSRIESCETLTPVDLESRFGVTGGHIHHGEHALDQLLFLRPSVDCGRYATPIDGLFLCGSGSHPGGGITGAPGMLGAHALLER
jgi:phytoene dehydrogenase-like protein